MCKNLLRPLYFSALIIHNYPEDFGGLCKLFTQTNCVQSAENYSEFTVALHRDSFSILKNKSAKAGEGLQQKIILSCSILPSHEQFVHLFSAADLETVVISPLSFLFCRLNNPNSFNLST